MKFQRELYNWYGIPSEYSEATINSINEKQIYNHFTLKGSIEPTEGWVKKSEGGLEKFSDKHKSNETRFYFSPTFEFPIKDSKIFTKINLDILHGEFALDYANSQPINYGYLNLGAEAVYAFNKEDFHISLGAKIIYNSDLENKKSKLHIYPDINVDFVLIDEVLNLYGGFTGGIVQNSYRNITLKNPYVSPTLNIKPTSNTFRIHGGFKGKITSTISYDVNASYSKDKDKLLYKSNKNLANMTTTVTNGYQAGNSFYVLYDNVATLGLFGELSATFFTSLETGLSLAINSYSMNKEEESWNLPPFVASIFSTYSIGKWSTKAELFAKGKRKDQLTNNFDNFIEKIEIDGYIDLNLSSNYTFNRKWSAFLELNNILNTNYQVYSNFQVQGFQILAGGIYRFDF